MLHYAVIFFIISLIAAVFGFADIAGDAAGVSKVLFFVFLLLAVVSFIANTARECPRKPSKRELARQRRAKELAQLAEWFPIGREFDYLGLRMRVWSHLAWSWDDSESWPAVQCEYVAGSTIKRHSLSMVEAEALHRQLACEVSP